MAAKGDAGPVAIRSVLCSTINWKSHAGRGCSRLHTHRSGPDDGRPSIAG